MAREHIITIWCDPCMDIDDVKVEGEETPPISLGNQKPRVMALCKQHWTDFYEPLQEFVTKFGVPVDRLLDGGPTKAKKTPTGSARDGVELPNGFKLPKGIAAHRAAEYKVVCPVPDCRELQRSAATVAGHLRTAHQTNLYETIGPDGTLFDIDGVSVDTPKPRKRDDSQAGMRTECDVPGCNTGPDGGPMVYEYPKNKKPLQALGVHKAKTHGIRGAGK